MLQSFSVPLRRPEGHIFQRGYIVNGVVATAGDAGQLISCGLRQHFWIFVVGGSFFIFAHAGVAMQALAIVVGGVELDFLRLGNFPQILHQHVVHTTPFRFVVAEEGVVGVAGKAGVIGRHEMVLEVDGGNITFVVHVETLAKIRHYVTGKTELGGGGALQMLIYARPHSQRGQDTQRHERQDFTTAHSG